MMKKVIFYAFLAMCAMLFVVACGGDSRKEYNELQEQYRQAINNHNFEAAYELKSKINSLIWHEIVNDRMNLNETDFEAKYGFDKYDSNEIEFSTYEVYEQEVKYLAVQGTSEANKRLLLLIIDNFPVEGTARSEGEKLLVDEPFSSEPRISAMNIRDKQYYNYHVYCDKINAECMKILDIAITLDNKELAELMIKTMKPNPDIKSIFRRKDEDSYKCYDIYAHYTTKTIDEAKAKYEKKFGKFDE